MSRYRLIVNGVPQRWEPLGKKSLPYMYYLMNSFNERFGDNWQLEFDFKEEEPSDELWYTTVFDETVL